MPFNPEAFSNTASPTPDKPPINPVEETSEASSGTKSRKFYEDAITGDAQFVERLFDLADEFIVKLRVERKDDTEAINAAEALYQRMEELRTELKEVDQETLEVVESDPARRKELSQRHAELLRELQEKTKELVPRE